MTTQLQQQPSGRQRLGSLVQGINELNWFNHILDFVFKLTAFASEGLLAAGVILSTANHFQHGALFSTIVPLAHGKSLQVDTPIFQAWTWTQAVGFEASAGIQESRLPAWYGIFMAILRGIVSVAYVTIGRVKNLRFSGNPVLQPVEVPDVIRGLEELQSQFQGIQAQSQAMIEGVHLSVNRVSEQLLSVQSNIPALVQAQSHMIIAEVQQVVQLQLTQAVGSGTNKQDMVDWEEQSILKKRSLQWSPSPYTAPTVRATLWSAMDMLPMANSCIAAARADGKVARTRLPMPICKTAVRRFCTPTKNAAACVASRVRLASRARLFQVGSKKSSSASPLMDDPTHPGPRGSRFHHPGTG